MSVLNQPMFSECSAQPMEIPVHCFGEVTSTMILARRLCSGLSLPCCILAHAQTAGRGRLGKTFISEAHAGLWCTVVLPIEMEQKPLWQWGGLNLVAALSVVECLLPMLHPEKAPHLAIKWPNDVLWQSHKLAGILTECVHTQHHNALLLGIGINLLAPTQVPQAVGLSSLLKGHADHTIDTLTPLALWKRLEKVLLPHWHMFRQWGFAPFVASYTHYDALFQKSIHFEEKGQRQTACANGVDDYGRLKVNYADGRSALCASGEVQQITRP